MNQTSMRIDTSPPIDSDHININNENKCDASNSLIIKRLEKADYNETHKLMLQRTLERVELKKQKLPTGANELWIVDHNDVYTLGQAGKPEHILQRNDTPIIQTDRGGQVTWHGHGQLVLYWLFDLNDLNWKVRDLVSHAEQSIEDVVNQYITPIDYQAKARSEAPGVYVYDKEQHMLGKIASLGFKIKHGFSYHGIALNIHCDLSAFDAINPCGYAGMQMLRLIDFVETDNKKQFYNDVTLALVENIKLRHLGQIKLK